MPRTLLLLLALAGPALADLSAGVARVEFTPSGRVPLAGYGSRFGKLSTGVHDPVHARALALEADGRRFVLAVVDLVGITREVREDVVARLPDLRPDEVLIAATHDHSGPGGFGRHPLATVTCGFYSDERREAVVAAVVEAIRRAREALAPARLGTGTVDLTGFSRNRRVSGGPVDPEGGLVRVERVDGSLLAVWVHFTAHPTLLSGDNLEVSAEWPGALCFALEEAHPGATALFTNGAEGDQSPAGVRGDGDFARVADYGRRLAEAVEGPLSALRTSGDLAIRTRLDEVDLPLSAFGDFVPRRSWLHRVELGDTVWYGIPGEPVVEIGLELKAAALAAGHRAGFVIGLANDHLGYFTTRAGYYADTYESRMNFYGPGMAEFLVDRLAGRAAAVAEPTAWRRDISGLDVAFVSGSPREIGRAHGRLYAPEIRALARDVTRLAIRGAREALSRDGLDPVRLLLLGHVEELAAGVVAQRLRPALAAVDPDLLLEIEAIAEGAGVPADLVLLVNHYPELVEPAAARSVFDVESILGARDASPRDLVVRSCGTWARLPGEACFGRVCDVPVPILATMPCVLVRRPTVGCATLSVGWPGLAGIVTGLSDQLQVAGCSSWGLGLDMPVHLRYRTRLQDGSAAFAPTEALDGPAAVRGRMGDGTLHAAVFDVWGGRVDVWRSRGEVGWVGLDPAPLFRGEVPGGAKEVRPYGDPSDLLYRHAPFEATVRVLREPGLLPGETRVEFPSPSPSGVPENDRVYGYLYEPAGASDDAIVLLPIWKGPSLDLETSVARILAAMGHRVFVMPLAYQFERAPAGRSGDLTISSDLARNRSSMIQSAQDAQRAAWWLVHERGVRADRVAVMGISMGGHVAALAYGASETFCAGIFVIAGGRVADTLWNGSETQGIRRRLAADGLNLCDLRGLSRDYDPLTYASPSRGRGVYMVGGRFDDVVLPSSVLALAEGYGGVDVDWLPSGHYTAWIGFPSILARIDEHLDGLEEAGR